jgi:energy-converting hydrogenase Eha subunit H
MLSKIVLGIFVFMMVVFMVILIMETISSAADAEKRRKKQSSKNRETKTIIKRSKPSPDDYFDKYNRRD